MTERMLTRRDLATFYRVTTRTVDEWRREGRLPPAELTPSGRPRWRESALAALQGATHEPSREPQAA